MDDCCIGSDESVMCVGNKVKRTASPGFFGTTSKESEYWVQAVRLKDKGKDRMDISLGEYGFGPIENKNCSKFKLVTSTRVGGGRGYKKRKIKKKKSKRTKKIKTRKYKKSKRKRY